MRHPEFSVRRSFAIIILMLPFLAACNLPFQTIEPTVDVVATRVAVDLSKTPPPIIPTIVAATATPGATSIPPTTTATNTPAYTATTEPSPTTASTDPKASLGKPTWTGSFQNAKNWGLSSPYDDGHTRVEILNESMVLTSANAEGWLGWWQLSNQKPQDFYLEATLKVGTCSGNDLYGIIFRSPDNAKGYWFGVTCDGRFNLRSGEAGSLSDVIKTAPGDSILVGSDQTNRLGIMAKGSEISLYANGKPVGNASDTAFTDKGTFGLFIAGQKTVNFSYACSEIAYWDLH